MADDTTMPPEDTAQPRNEAAEHTHRDTASEHHRGRTILKWIGIVLAGLVALVAILLLLLNTGPGKRFIIGQLEGMEFENGMEIGIGSIDGSIYGEIVINDLEVRDPQGVFLTSPEITVDWRPFAFVNNHVDVRSLTSPLITLQRLPEFNETPPSEDPLLPDLDIDVNRLRIDRFVAEAPVAGERRVASMAGEVHIADGRAQVQFAANTLRERGSNAPGGDRLALTLDAVPEENRLDIDLALDAPGDGVIAAMAGLTEPLTVRLDGEGDWQSWSGDLDANLAGSEFARLDLTARDGTISVEGSTRVARLFDGPTAALLGPVLNIDLTAALEERSAQLSGGVGSDAFRLDTDGGIDLSDNSFDDLDVRFVLFRPSALAENLAGRGITADLTLDGEFATPAVDYQITAARIAMNDMGIENLRASGNANVRSDQILIPVSASIGRITGVDTVAGGSLQDVRLSGDIAIEGPRILSDNMTITSDRLNADLVLLADTSTGIYTGAINGRLDDYRIESVGIFDITTDVDLTTEANGGFALAGRVGVRSTRIDNESLADFLGGNAVAGADIRYGGDGTLRFRNLRLESPGARITGGYGSYSPDGRIALNADGVSEAYGAIGVRVAGTISDPDARITAERPGLGIGLANLDARVTGAPGGYRLVADADTDYGPLTADVVLGMGDVTTLDITEANLGGIAFAGSLRQTPSGPFAGRLTADGQGLGGVVRLSAQGQYQQALVNLRARNTQLPGPGNFAVESAIVDARIVLYDQPLVKADAQLAGFTYGTTRLAAGRVKVDYRDGRGNAQVLAEGVAGVPFRVAANADLQPDLWRIAAKGRARGIEFSTNGPARIVPGDDGSYELLPSRIDLGGGQIRLAGNYGDGIKLQSRLEDIDIAIANAFSPELGLGGKASGSLDFLQTSPGAFPRADARIHIDDFTRTTAAAVSQPVDINFVGKLLADGGEARAVLRRSGTVIGRMVASLRPLPPGSGDWVTRMMAAPLGGGVRYNGPAGTLFSFAGQPDQTLSGPLAVAADFSGRVQRPELQGIVRGQNLTYENQTYGTRLTRMNLRGQFTGSRFELENLDARAGDGTVSAQGFVSLAAESGYPMDIQVTMDEAQLADSDALAATATGNLALTKQAGQTALLSGRIRLPETRYKIVTQAAAEVPTLTGVRFKPPRGPQRITGDEPAEPQPGLLDMVRLDLTVVAPERLYVSGMGLESEWSADLNLTGTSASPSLAGTIELIRGTLGFAGRSFELEEGLVTFTGGTGIDPTINLLATEDIEDVLVRVSVTGRAMDPQIGFSSTPGLPQDEIVSRILFGSSVANLSAIQAVQLAASLNSLRGSGGGGLNPLGTLRSATGIDRLRVLGGDDETGRGTALAAGQYLTDDIYVELITDARGFTATQIEVALTPALSVLSTAGGSSAVDVSVQYQKDY
ncbi:translocation/assembly module TamB domain-containing protein [Croceicoccus marinus]|uniref:Translocation/assembly module TamB domain-containing protein n=1 Tax=Croceicoccus marinus TaxID=450378 RepID=A0A7G6VQW1_9SPHN|nr:translocation/assembly module TamB domain-containing protein [Croceicoccus marinus]QNE04126.1 translocation/assembly module TamB domain-containing protein [Croceicoccus marinus]